MVFTGGGGVCSFVGVRHGKAGYEQPGEPDPLPAVENAIFLLDGGSCQWSGRRYSASGTRGGTLVLPCAFSWLLAPCLRDIDIGHKHKHSLHFPSARSQTCAIVPPVFFKLSPCSNDGLLLH